MLEKLNFKSFEFNSRKEVLIGIDENRQYVIKIEVSKNPRKERDIEGEYEIIKSLNESGCKTCPQAYELGKISKDDIYEKVKEKEILDKSVTTKYGYIIQQYIPNSGTPSLADIMLSLLEQKNLGVYQGDIKTGNLRFNKTTSVCYIIDYDQAIFLTGDQRNLSNYKFLNLCTAYDKEKYGFGNWLRHLHQYGQKDIDKLFQDESFNLGNTTIFQTQKTTNSATGFYHTIREKDIFIEGSRAVDARAELLNELCFKEGETVLDVGCNAGLLCMYLDARGCSTTGVDNDSRIVIASKIVANILGKEIDYYHMDLDHAEELEKFDTIMLFSVLHHTRNIHENAKKIANSCNRIILESRLFESGKQPYGDTWIDTSKWNFRDVFELVGFCEKIFSGFKLNRNLGLGSKNRYIIEFIKEGVIL
jgi:2-polyprenyl-3-methyl-5-hydroxy-6-metoxy-1,4-benzoquinol methylase